MGGAHAESGGGANARANKKKKNPASDLKVSQMAAWVDRYDTTRYDTMVCVCVSSSE